MRIIDATYTAKARPSMFLHGITGNGKSTWTTKGGTPLVILTEAKAESVLRLVNPQAIGLVPTSLDDLDRLLEILGDPAKLGNRGIDRIILDSFTELTLAAPRWINQRAGRSMGVATKLELAQYGELGDYALAVVKAIQLTGYPSVIIGRSTSKRTGLVERIQPDGLGKSVEQLPGKLLPTAEARYDSELGYVIDTSPVDYSQRCGLPWVPPLWTGTCLDYLNLIEHGPQMLEAEPTKPAPPADPPKPKNTPAKAAAPKPAPPVTPAVPPRGAIVPGGDDDAWVDLMARLASGTVLRPIEERNAIIVEWSKLYLQDATAAKEALAEYIKTLAPVRADAPDPEADPEGYKAAFGKACVDQHEENRAAVKAAPVDQAAAAFVDGVSPEMAKPDDVAELLDLCTKHKASHDALWRYAIAKEQAKPGKDGSKNWNSLSKAFVAKTTHQFREQGTTAAFISWLHLNHK